MKIYENKNINIQIEKSEVPWLKIFTNKDYKELSACPKEIRYEIFELLNIIEEEMIKYYNPTKINLASFGNYLPHVHFHIMARFENDSYFPEPMWGKRQREGNLKLQSFEEFCNIVTKRLNS